MFPEVQPFAQQLTTPSAMHQMNDVFGSNGGECFKLDLATNPWSSPPMDEIRIGSPLEMPPSYVQQQFVTPLKAIRQPLVTQQRAGASCSPMEEPRDGCRSVDSNRTETSDYGSCVTPLPSPPQQPMHAGGAKQPCADALRNFVNDFITTADINRQHVMLRQMSVQAPPPPSHQASVNEQLQPPPAISEETDESVFADEELEDMKRALFRPKKVPDANYTCHICYKSGDHLIYDCPKRHEVGQDERTPYQGPKKCYGEYACPRCKRRWNSGNSFANMPQFCVKCKDVPVYPRKQLPIDKALEKGVLPQSPPSAAVGVNPAIGSPLVLINVNHFQPQPRSLPMPANMWPLRNYNM